MSKRGFPLRTVLELTGRGQTRLRAALMHQIEVTSEGARLARCVVLGRTAPPDARARMTTIEHRGDDARAALVAELSAALVTPLDREDIFRLSRSIDDVLDDLRDFVRSLDLLPVRRELAMAHLLREIEHCLQQLDQAVSVILATPAVAQQQALHASKSVNRIRQRYQEALSTLLRNGPVTLELLRRRELLRQLDLIGTRLGQAASIMSDGAVKRA